MKAIRETSGGALPRVRGIRTRWPCVVMLAVQGFFLFPVTCSARSSELEKLLAYYDSIYDASAAMLVVPFESPGYHSRVPAGALVHPVRESLYYAIALMQRGRDEDAARAEAILTKILPLQESRPTSSAYGVWPWFLEEPLEQMASVDLNWADFCGMAIAHLIVEHEDAFSRPRRRQMTMALRRAAEAIRRRDVQPAYTNIAVLGGGVCVIAGEVLDDPVMLEYGRDRLQDVVRHTERQGSFNEYNSPPYGKVVVAECERILQLCRDAASRQAADALRHFAWRMIAESFHGPTQQWAGPHSRTSRDRLRSTMTAFLSQRVDTPIVPHPDARDERPRGYAVVAPIPCPPPWKAAFRKPLTSNRTHRRVFIRPRGREPAVVGTTWFSPQSCLGSVSRSSFWTQRKPIIGYWKTVADPAVVFRVRFLHDGRDFASMGVVTRQSENRLLCSVHPLIRRGDWHRTLDRPDNGVFRASDFRLRFELRGAQVRGLSLGEQRFALVAGSRQIVVHGTVSRFHGEPVRWAVEQAPGFAAVDAICYLGRERGFSFATLFDVQLAAGVELISREAQPISRTPQRGKQGVEWPTSGVPGLPPTN